MGHAVVEKRGVVSEGFTTVLALIGLLSSMGSLVFHQCGGVNKGLPALAALVQLLSGVNLHMLNK